MKGPDLLQPQFGILIRFRENLVAVSADIERMFNQVLVPKCDRSDLRFIWQQLGTTEPLRTYEIYVQVFGCISSPITCNYTLLRAAQDGFGDFPVAEARVQANFYVDNYLEKAASAAYATFLRSLTEVVLGLRSGCLRQGAYYRACRLIVAENLNWTSRETPTENTLGLQWDA